ncbi:MAG: type I methionyl aminopeptidase [Gemmatimonadetes bacterium]|nr:type I methionyl aminopeptidase [Gemmatimonadota bacterium]
MIELKTPREIEEIARAGGIIGALFREIERSVVAGESTLGLDRFAEEFIRSHPGAVPVFKGLYGFPGSLCTSINEEVVHGIPSDERILRDGDIISIDVGVKLDGWCSDSARTFPVGEVSPEREHLLSVTREALDRAVEAAVPGAHVGDIGHAVEKVVEGTGFSIVRDLVGHGIGRKVHEDPQVPNRGRPGAGLELREGMVLAIEPMIAVGSYRTRTLKDNWTVVTADGSPAAHFEHTVALTADGPRILTAEQSRVGTG